MNRRFCAIGLLGWGICTLVLTVSAPALAGDDKSAWRSAPIIKLIRQATWQFRDVEVAESMGYVRDPFCVSGAERGATGVHLVNPGLIGDGVVNAETPELLVYEPKPNGKLRLVAVEYVVFADGPVHVEGHLMQRTSAPNRFGIPAPFLRLHVWAWKRNPNGTFADFNPNASCDAQPLTR